MCGVPTTSSSLISDCHTYSKLGNFSDLSFRSWILNYDSKLSACPAVPLSRAVVPLGEFDKSLSVCFDRPIHPLSSPTRDPTNLRTRTSSPMAD